MERRGRRRLWELSLIYLAAVCLMGAVVFLSGRVLLDRAAAGAADPYPRLYASGGTAFEEEAGPTVYLTFDDGPSHNTERILDMLREKEAPATFFVSGQTADEAYSGELLRRMAAEGHAVGLHSYTHDTGEIYRSADAYLADLERLRAWIEEAAGVHPDILRFAGGSATRMAAPEVIDGLIREITRRGYVYYDWNAVSGDDTGEVIPADVLADNVLRQAAGREVVVVLFHDNPTPATTPEAAALVIDALREQGYRFERITPKTAPIQLRTVEE